MLKHQSVASDRAGGIIATSRFIRMALQVIMLATGGYLAIQDLISPGTMIAASIIMGRALAPVDMAVSQWKNFVSARNAYGKLKKLIEQYPDEGEKMDLPPPRGSVMLQNAFIVPPGSQTSVVNNLSLAFEPATVTGYCGAERQRKNLSLACIGGSLASYERMCDMMGRA